MRAFDCKSKSGTRSTFRQTLTAALRQLVGAAYGPRLGLSLTSIMASRRPQVMLQNILDGPEEALNQHIPIHTIREVDIPSSDLFETFDHARPLGISPGFSDKGRLNALAVADDNNCRIIEFTPPKSQRGGNNRPPPGLPQALPHRTLLEDKILCRPVGDLLAFDFGPLSMSLYCDTNLRITNAVDIQSAFSAVDRKPLTAIKQSVGEDIEVKKENIVTLFNNPVYSAEDRQSTTDLAMRAWVAQFLAGYGNGAETFEKVPRIDTKKLTSLVSLLFISILSGVSYIFDRFSI